MKIALTKMNQAWEDKSQNMDICNQISSQASNHNIDLLIFPEMTLTGFTSQTLKIAEDASCSSSLLFFSEIASTYNFAVVAGAVLRSNGIYQNLAVAHDAKGVKVSSYAKMHPFSPGGENGCITAGTSSSFFKYKGIRFALTICYDLRFPVFWDALADRCDCIINIANWPAVRVGHWKTLLQARAIENQLYVIGVNRVGLDGNRLNYVESSYCFSPDGEELSPIFLDSQFDIVEIDKENVLSCRKKFPVRNDIRRDLYREILKVN
jgi:omega-amidase